ncbi:MAG: replication-associated recombination protein A, partial [Gammaproteobacteria bacterium]|nr:replication-associated recombination protein A [Gammaproteobacteria bacterium]
IRTVLDRAEARQQAQQGETVLFVDEIHRFNKSQQDAFLPALESGLITLIGATTENPAFSLNNALLSRARVYALKSLEARDLEPLLHRAIIQENLIIASDEVATLIAAADGDARQLLNLIEMCGDVSEDRQITTAILKSILGETLHRFDKGGDYFYDLISALHKSIRGSDPDAALYWMIRMLRSGCDPLYIARRLIRMASEEIGIADPRALEMTLNAWQVIERLGIPEGELALSQAVIYLAVAPKSNAVYLAHKHAEEAVKNNGSLDVPFHLRNQPIKYRYPHDEPHAYAAGVNYFPASLQPTTPYYQPSDRGLEKQIQEKLKFLKHLTS